MNRNLFLPMADTLIALGKTRLLVKLSFGHMFAMMIFSSFASAQIKPLDDFETLAGWKAIASDGVRIDTALVAGRTHHGVKIAFDFVAGAGYCGVQKQFPLTLPENFQFSFYVRGEAPINNFEFKLVDASGDNVWWLNQRNFEFPETWTKVTIKKRHIEFAWGPTNDRALQNIDKIEFFIASSTGGKGAVYLDDFQFEALPPPSNILPQPLFSASTHNESIKHIADGDPQTFWQSAAQPAQQEVVLDLQNSTEFGGLVIDWDEKDFARKYDVLSSNEGKQWDVAYAVAAGKAGRSYISLKDHQARYLKLQLQESSRGQGYALRELALKPVAFSQSPEAFFTTIAADHPRGYFPKYLYNQQSYWNVVGVNHDTKEALINEEGMIEVDKSSFSLMPFIFYEGKLLTWNDVALAQSLEQDYLPIPTVAWRHADLQLNITAFAGGAADSSLLYVTYRLGNLAQKNVQGSLYLAVRPFQVNPPAQFLNWPGGTAKVKSIRREGEAIIINEKKKLLSLRAYDNFGALTFDEGDITEFLARDAMPANAAINDHFGYASAALQYRFSLSPNEEKLISLAIPFHEQYAPPLQSAGQAREDVAKFWEEKTNTVDLHLPASAPPLANLVRSNLAYILINRDRAGIQPGSRSYERSWIRDGALTSAALLRFGIQKEVREFIDWYAQYQYPNGKIPCVVDTRGADPVPENDSHGEFIYAVLQYFRFSNDTLWLRQKFPQIVKTVEYIEFLRNQRKTEVYLNGTAEQRACYGLLPESISHEGYSAKPMHSYWDDFFGVKGLKDATTIAEILGERARAEEFAAARDDFKRFLYASMRLAMANTAIDYIPGCAELGDFDATSTAIGLDPCGELANIPQPQLNNTFEKYFQFFTERREGKLNWVDYTPYETRLIGAFVLLGQRERAHELLQFFLGDQRPRGWNHWAEVVGRNANQPRFIGDMPHTWVGSDFIRAVRNMFVYETDDDALVLGAGILADWVRDPVGVEVKRLPTYYGVLNYSMKREGKNVMVKLTGELHVPKGGIVLKSPLHTPLKAVRVNGKASKAFTHDEAIIASFPAEVRLSY
ncbi:discoidin domain-containing protein [candidate division KSB1 bacterium]|nr:discoidin domain-containing protein [candidate division KSB1 bacterium]